MLQAVILAGGRGSRLGKITDSTPKPLIKIANIPIIERQIQLLKRFGVKEIWVVSGYLGEKIKNYLGDGSRFGIRICHIVETKPLGTGGALKVLEGILKRDFILFSGDVVLDIDINSLVKFHQKKKGLGAVVVHPSDHPFDSDIVEVTPDERIKSLILRKGKRQASDLVFSNLTCTSTYVFSPMIFKFIKKEEVCDLEKGVFPRIFKTKKSLFAYRSAEYIKDIGTPERLREAEKDMLSDKVNRLNRKNKRPAVFLDRDGVINTEIDQLLNANDLKLIPGSAKAIKSINDSGFLAIVITNQASIAKGLLTEDGLRQIHNKLETLLAKSGAKLDAIYHCPHHPDKGYEGEIKSLKINCSCRKPKIGLIKKAVRDFHIDLDKSFFIGDSTVDAETARRANIQFIGVKTGYALLDGRLSVQIKPAIKMDLSSAIEYAIK